MLRNRPYRARDQLHLYFHPVQLLGAARRARYNQRAAHPPTIEICSRPVPPHPAENAFDQRVTLIVHKLPQCGAVPEVRVFVREATWELSGNSLAISIQSNGLYPRRMRA